MILTNNTHFKTVVAILEQFSYEIEQGNYGLFGKINRSYSFIKDKTEWFRLSNFDAFFDPSAERTDEVERFIQKSGEIVRSAIQMFREIPDQYTPDYSRGYKDERLGHIMMNYKISEKIVDDMNKIKDELETLILGFTVEIENRLYGRFNVDRYRNIIRKKYKSFLNKLELLLNHYQALDQVIYQIYNSSNGVTILQKQRLDNVFTILFDNYGTAELIHVVTLLINQIRF